MASIAAKKVAEEVLETIGKGERPSVLKIAPKHGYAKSTANSGQIQKTKTYRKEIEPLLDQIEAERQAIIKQLKKTRDKAKYRDLMDGLDKTTKIYQILTGGKTGNEPIIYTWKQPQGR